MKRLGNTFFTAVALVLVAFAAGCAYDGQESGNYPPPSHEHHH